MGHQSATRITLRDARVQEIQSGQICGLNQCQDHGSQLVL